MRRVVLTGVCWFMLAGVVLAQGTPPPPPTATPAAPASTPDAAEPPTDPVEARKLALKKLELIRTIFDSLTRRYDEAVEAQDAVLANCLGDLLLQLKQLLNVAEGQYTLYLAADTRGDGIAVTHLARLFEITQRALAFDALAAECVGNDDIFFAPTTVEVEGPDGTDEPDFPSVDPLIPIIEPPPVGSPFY